MWAAKGGLGYSMSKRVILTLVCVARRTSDQEEPEPGSQGAWLGMRRGDTGCRVQWPGGHVRARSGWQR